MRIIKGTGPSRCRWFILGERPGSEEYEQGRCFVGPAGKELWARVWKILRLNRDDVYVSNLVKTFATTPPTPDEIARDAILLRAELVKVQPDLIITIGYHAARALLPQFAKKKGEFFHGLPYAYTYGKLQPRTCTIVPCCHSSAALRQPDRFQQQFTEDLMAVKKVMDILKDGRIVLHHGSARPKPYQVGLAGFGAPGQLLGVDTEGSKESPECVTVARGAVEVACIETHHQKRPTTPFLGASLHHASALAIHYCFADVPVLAKLGIRNLPPIHDTMLEAYLLGKSQSLKVLAYRELGYEMDAYLDLVQPLDDALVEKTLRTQLEQWEATLENLMAKACRIAGARAVAKVKGTTKKVKVTKKAIAATFKRLHAKSDVPANRVISGLAKMLRTKDEANEGEEE